ncbi:hypothetical protein ACS0TY_027713 [Phlomoides rotata]
MWMVVLLGGPGRITVGGVYCDSFGVFIGCFVITHGMGFAFDAELATAFSAIEMAYDKNWRNIWLECDSVYVVSVLKTHDSAVPWRLLAQWHMIHKLIGELQLVVSHIYREGNATTDILTREPVDRFNWWHQAPDFLRPFVLEIGMRNFIVFSCNRGVPFSLCVGFVPKEGFPTTRFLTGPDLWTVL